MIRMRPPRSVCTTTSNLCLAEWPSVTHRGSRIECSGSSIVTDSRSPKIVVASSKETPCFRKLVRLFSLSHSKSKPILTHTPAHPIQRATVSQRDIHFNSPPALLLRNCICGAPSKHSFQRNEPHLLPTLSCKSKARAANPFMDLLCSFSAIGYPP